MAKNPLPGSWVTRARATYFGLALLFAGWSACAVDRSGLFPSSVEQSNTGGQTPSSGGQTGGGGSGGAAYPLGTGGTLSGTGGRGSGGMAGGNGVKGGATGKGGAVGPPSTPVGGKGGTAGRGGAIGGTGSGGWNGSGSGSGGWNGSGSGGWTGNLSMCDPSIRDKDACTPGSADCRKTCGVSSMATKPCTCSFGIWSCGDCTYPTGDYSCYRLSAASVPNCAPGTVNGTTACMRACSLCSGYRDTTGTEKAGYCACTDDEGSAPPVYHCASTNEWPPQ